MYDEEGQQISPAEAAQQRKMTSGDGSKDPGEVTGGGGRATEPPYPGPSKPPDPEPTEDPEPAQPRPSISEMVRTLVLIWLA